MGSLTFVIFLSQINSMPKHIHAHQGGIDRRIRQPQEKQKADKHPHVGLQSPEEKKGRTVVQEATLEATDHHHLGTSPPSVPLQVRTRLREQHLHLPLSPHCTGSLLLLSSQGGYSPRLAVSLLRVFRQSWFQGLGSMANWLLLSCDPAPSKAG